MSRILTDDEIAALLGAVADGAIPAGGTAGAGARGVRPVDLTRQERTLRGRTAGLEAVAEHFARRLRTLLGTAFPERPQVTVRALERLRFERVLARLPRPLCVQLFRLAPLRGEAMLVLTPPLVAALLQTACGGAPSRRAAIAGRELSPIEQRVLERLAGRILGELAEAWRPLGAVECALVGSETTPMLAAVAAPHELVVLVELAVEAEGVEEATLSVVLRDASLDPVRQRLHAPAAAAGEAPAPAWGEGWRALLADAELEVAAELGGRRMRLAEVLGLRVGDVLTLRTGRQGPVCLRVAGRPCFVGEPGVSNGSHAVRVTGRA